MNNNIAFSSMEAENLNKMVCDTIAEHLFILCNYNPESVLVFSEDARFMQASLNMYKLLVDAGICNNLRIIGKKYSINYDYTGLENIINIIYSIRTTLGHNLDIRNGNEEDKQVVEQWFLKVVGKTKLTTSGEYKKVVEEIEKYGENSVNILKNFIEIAGKSKKKSEIIREWEKLIIKFYKRPNSKNIIEGQIMLAFQSRLGNTQKISKVIVASWVEKMFFYREKLLINNLQEIMQKGSFSTTIINEFKEKINEYELMIINKNNKIAFFFKKKLTHLGCMIIGIIIFICYLLK